MRVCLETDARQVGLRCLPANEERLFDLTVEGKLAETFRLPAGQEEVRFQELPGGPKRLEIWLSQGHPVAVRDLLLSPDASLSVTEDTRLRWVTYGSSITHCGGAHSAHLAPCVARPGMERLPRLWWAVPSRADARPPSAICPQLHLAEVRNQCRAALARHTFKPAIIGLVNRSRSTPDDRRHLADHLPPRETEKTTSASRPICAWKWKTPWRGWSPRETATSSTVMVSTCSEELAADYLPDQLHPNGDGYERLAKNFIEKVARRVLPGATAR